MPDTNLALLSIPGDYVRDVSLKLVELGIHQQIFSDHVPIEDELEIKTLAAGKGVLILGPGAGTSIINGKGIGFSNAVKEGPVGIVAAAGTGLQEVATLLDHCGIGVKHGLGVGGNDPKDKIGGIMMMQCIKMLESVPDVGIIGIVSKPPSPSVQEKIVSYIAKNATKKYVLAFIGGTGVDQKDGGRIVQVNTLASAVLAIAKQLGAKQFQRAVAETYVHPKDLMPVLESEWMKLAPGQKRIRALYTGGTFTYEAEMILDSILTDEPIYSNAPILSIKPLDDSFKSQETSIVDLGEEEFTSGRPHPMIDPTVRKYRIAEEAADPSVAVLLMDFVLGYGSHPDPVGAAINEINDAKRAAEKAGRHLCVVAHICGTSGDLQGYNRSVDRLKSAGCVVLPTNALAAVAAAVVARRGKVDINAVYARYLTAGEKIR
jgi:FdrA protein